MVNPLVAREEGSTTAVSGIALLEGAQALRESIESGDWASVVLGAGGAGLDALGVVLDPFGSILTAGVAWLLEHVGPLKDALDALAGDPDAVRAHAQTWRDIAVELGEVSAELGARVEADLVSWGGEAADTYRRHARGVAELIGATEEAGAGIAAGIETSGEVVAAVRSLVRDTIAEVVSRLVSWALQVLSTLGLGLLWVVPQVANQVRKTANRIADLVFRLAQALKALGELLRGAGAIFTETTARLRRIESTPAARTVEQATLTSSARRVDPVPGADGVTSTSRAAPTGDRVAPPPELPGTAREGAVRQTSVPAWWYKQNNQPVPRPPADYQGTLPTDTPAHLRPTVSDPVDIATGEVVLVQTDVDLPGLLPLVLRRTHLSSHRVGRGFGRSWASALDQRLWLGGDRAVLVTDDGMHLSYPLPLDDTPVLPRSGPRRPLARTAAGTWTVTDPLRRQMFTFAPVEGDPRTLPLVSVTGDGGGWLTVDRTSDGTPAAVRHHGGYALRVETEEGRVTGLWALGHGDNPEVRIVTYRYDAAGDLVEVVNSSGVPMRFSYDDVGRITRWVARTGMWYEYVYDDSGRCVRTIGAGGYLSGTFQYDTENRVSRYTDSLGHTRTYHLDAAHRLVAEVDPLGNTTRYERDALGNPVATTDPLGNTTRREYGGHGELVAVVLPDGARTTFTYDGRWRPLATTHPDGTASRNEYDADGRLVATVDQAGERTAYAYDEEGGLASVTDPLGGVTAVRTNAAGLPTWVRDPAGAVTRYAYDRFGRTDSVVDAAGGTTRYTWTVEGLPLSVTAPDRTTRSWRHSADGVVQEAVDVAGRSTVLAHGHFDLLTGEVSPDGSRLAYRHDTELRLISVTNQLGLVWRYEHDAAGRLVREVDFDGREQRYRYDAAGRLVERVNAEGQVVRIEWDVRGRMTRRVTPDGVVEFAYDAVGRLVRARNTDADVVLEYDVCGRVVAEAVNGHRVVSRYDALGRRTHRRTPTGAESTWVYDGSDLPAELRAAGETTRFTHDPVGREVERRIGTGVLLAQQWHTGGRLVAQTVVGGGEVVQRRTFTHHPDDSPAEVHDLLSGTRHYGVDALGRVTAVDWRSAGVSERYGYDPAGTVVAARPGLAAHDATTGPRLVVGTLVRQAGGLRYEHDREGRVVLRERRSAGRVDTWRYRWDAENRLAAVSTPDGQRWRYAYDPFGRRIGKHRTGPAGAVAESVRFAWDGDTVVEQVRDETAATVWDWAPGTYRVVAQTERARRPGADWVDREFCTVVTDRIGTPTELVTPSGELVWHARWTLWGLPVDTHQDATPLRFPGQYHDRETGLHFNLHRYYDPAIGQYLSHDPLGLAPGPHPRHYVSNPLVWADPLGLDPITHGRPDKQVVLSGHGGITPGSTEKVTVPEGTLLHFYSQRRQEITDRLGNAVELGYATPAYTYGPGSVVPNYQLSPPHGLKILGAPKTVSEAKHLSELLRPGMGEVHWAACRMGG
ncbi:hypothetical protein ALI22I_01980 [Saccharothrix sp. ALI-22-I]|uniref:putative adhesin n=1 Tax=Saccharothrix sp. ALI-22-I TaxID=1933778 RepID=UPI00097CB827|nr:RHS repeat-associated core domain-containing protein [Saccharothrix sp. ALI-22-I]ONI92753.1 hypothetical protein ALI22I_01980 [Saccharothrix sp. ALI-22-I]